MAGSDVLRDLPEEERDKILELWKRPEIASRLELLTDLVSHEAFFYIDGQGLPAKFPTLPAKKPGQKSDTANGDDLSLKQLEANGNLETYDAVAREFGPILSEAASVTRRKFLPAMQDGQSALVFSGRYTDTAMVPNEDGEPVKLPFPAVAYVQGIVDANLLRDASGDYLALAQRSVDAAIKLSGGIVPELTVPPPQVDKAEDGLLFTFPGLEVAGPTTIAPCAGLRPDFLVLSLLPDQARALLKPTPFTRPGPLSRADRPAAQATWIDIAGLADVWSKWTEFGLEHSDGIPADVGGEEQKEHQEALLRALFPLLKCLGQYSSITYFEGPVRIEHSEWGARRRPWAWGSWPRPRP